MGCHNEALSRPGRGCGVKSPSQIADNRWMRRNGNLTVGVTPDAESGQVAERDPASKVRGRWLPTSGTLPDDAWRTRHRGILWLLAAQVPALFVFALARGYGWGHGLLEVLPVAMLAVVAYCSTNRRRTSMVSASLGLMTASAVLVHLSGGTIEAHFLFFVMVGVIALYQDWVPLLAALAFVVLHHGILGVLAPHDVYNHAGAWRHPWVWAGVHGGFLLAVSAAAIAHWKLNERAQAQLSRTAAIVESSADAIYGWAPDGTINSWNRGAVDLFGYSRDEIVGQSLLVLIPPWRRGETDRQLGEVRHGRGMEPFDTERVGKDGTLVDVSVTVSCVSDPSGNVVGGATIARDITTRRRAEKAERSSEARTHGIIDSARDAYVGIDDVGLLTDWNYSAETAFGWSRDEVIGRSLAELITPPELREADEAGLFRHQSTGDPPVIERRVEMSALHRDGHQFPIEMAIWRVDTDAGGHFSAFIQDITERKRNDAELRRTLSLLGATLEATADGVFVCDLNGEAISFNSHFADMWSMPESHRRLVDMAQGMAFAVTLLENPEAFLASTGEVFAQPDADYDDTLRFKDGQVLERRSRPQRVDGVVVGRVWSFHDVTERNRLEAQLAVARDEALESSRLKSDFLATMSHEIRTPMNGVIGLTGLLLDSELTETQRMYADGVRASGEALLGIINDILDFSKIEAGKLELEMVDFDLAQALDDVAFLVAETARTKGLELVVYCGPDMPTMLRGDVGRIRQILLNLASNALKFTDEGEVIVRACVGRSDDPGKVGVRLEVVDTGIGIAPGAARAAVRALLPGRRLHHPPLRRHRPGPRHLEATDRSHGWHHRRRQ